MEGNWFSRKERILYKVALYALPGAAHNLANPEDIVHRAFDIAEAWFRIAGDRAVQAERNDRAIEG